MPNILLNSCTGSRYAVEELSAHNLYSWRGLTNEFSKKIATPIHPNIIDNIDIYSAERGDLANEIFKILNEKKIDVIFPIYNDMMFSYLYKVLGFTKQQGEILSSKDKYTELAKSLCIPVPNTYTDIKEAQYPIIAKPVNGTGSIGVKVLNNYDDYFFFASGEDIQYNDLGKYYIFQDFLDGITTSVAGRLVDGELIFDCWYIIESSELPYRAETGFILDLNLEIDNSIKEDITKLTQELKLDNCAWMADYVYSNGKYYLVDFSPRLSVSAQSIIKYSANVDYNNIVLNSLLYKDNTKIELKKSIVYRYFDIPKGGYDVSFTGTSSIADEIELPQSTSYMKRLDLLMSFKGYAITSADTLSIAEEKWQTISQNIVLRDRCKIS